MYDEEADAFARHTTSCAASERGSHIKALLRHLPHVPAVSVDERSLATTTTP